MKVRGTRFEVREGGERDTPRVRLATYHSPMSTIRVELPTHLRTLGRIAGHEVTLDVPAPPTVRSALDALEAAYPMLRGTVRDHVTQERRAFLRFFACQQDISLDSPDAPLPDAVADGREPLIILGAVAGG
jgi:molybdopterin synthase sulfur carrier subunit